MGVDQGPIEDQRTEVGDRRDLLVGAAGVDDDDVAAFEPLGDEQVAGLGPDDLDQILAGGAGAGLLY